MRRKNPWNASSSRLSVQRSRLTGNAPISGKSRRQRASVRRTGRCSCGLSRSRGSSRSVPQGRRYRADAASRAGARARRAGASTAAGDSGRSKSSSRHREGAIYISPFIFMPSSPIIPLIPISFLAAHTQTVDRSAVAAFGDFAQEEVAEDGDALGVAQLFGIDEIGLDLGALQLRQDADEVGRSRAP